MANSDPKPLRSSLKSPNIPQRRGFNVSFEDMPRYLATTLSTTNSPNSSGHSHARNAPPDSISFLNGSSLDEVTCPDIDDLLPKTDYTYARTASYRKKHSDNVGRLSPNMSRRRIDGSVPIFISDDESEDGYGDEYDDEAVISRSQSFYNHQHSSGQDSKDDDINENVKRRVSSIHSMGYSSTPHYPHDPRISTHDHYYRGMLLRSGSHIKGASRLRGHQESSSSSDAINHDRSLGLVPTYRSDYNNSQDAALKSRLRGSKRNVTTTTTTVHTYEEGDEHLDKEAMDFAGDNEMKLKLDESQTEKKMPFVLRSLDGLDKEDEFSDDENIETDDVHSRRGMGLRRQHANQSFFYSIITTIITTIVTTTTTAAASVSSFAGSAGWAGTTLAKPVTVPARWMWRAVVSFCSWIVRQAATMLLIEMESKRRRRRGCCLCIIPFLLLLPLALLAGHYASDIKHHVSGFVSDSEATMSSAWAGFWSERQRTIGIPPPSVTVASDGERREMDMTQINNYIEQRVLQMYVQRQQEIPPGLTSDQVRAIVQAMISAEMGSTQTEIDSHINSVSGVLKEDISGLKTHLVGLQAQIHDAIRETQVVAGNVEKTKASVQSTSQEQGTEWLAASQMLETKFLDLRNDVNQLANQNTALVAMLKSCCQNNTALAGTVRAHMVSILSELGEDDKDSALGGLMAWMQEKYVGRAELDEKLSLVAASVTENLQSLLAAKLAAAETQKTGEREIKASIVSASIDELAVKSIVEEALVQFSADRVGMPDFALESAGGSVLSVRCSETYYRKTALVSVFGVPLYYTSNSPRTVIQPNVHPGECWAFKGSSGFIVIQLSQPIQPTGFTLEHIPKSLAPSGTIDSAPKSFTILGLKSEEDLEGSNMGNFSYLDNGKPIQHFQVQTQHQGVFQFIELRVLTNHGNPEYTCIYRVRVHGLP